MSERSRGVVFPTPLPCTNEAAPQPHNTFENQSDAAYWMAGVVGRYAAFGIPIETPLAIDLADTDKQSRQSRGLDPLKAQYTVPLGPVEAHEAMAAHIAGIYDRYSRTDSVLLHFDISAYTRAPETFPGAHLFQHKTVEALGKNITRAAMIAPAGAHIGLDVGFGWNVDQSLGQAPMKHLVRVVNSALEQWPTGPEYRAPRYVHIPFGLDRLGRTPASAKYYHPLANLRLGEDTRLAAGIMTPPPQDCSSAEREAALMRTVDLRNHIRRQAPNEVDVAPAFDLRRHSRARAEDLVRASERIARVRKSPPTPQR